MTQMNLSLKQTHRNKEQACGCQTGEAMGSWIGSLELADANYYIYRMDKQQSPTIQHRELYSISGDKPYGKEYEKENH